MLPNDLFWNAVEHLVKSEGDDRDVVELADAGDHVRDQVDRGGDIAAQEEERRLRPSGNPRVPGESPEQLREVRNQKQVLLDVRLTPSGAGYLGKIRGRRGLVRHL